ncbi:MAG: glycerol kinase GlpK [Saprospiraceae bacterium]|nr:glycerol kinase GlpK [Saprospiraceae bacterium]|tara:strand:+ start:4050 stop:5537 length:1488 start_codon:yes stop_codon:yes gene_type:complete
MGDSKYVMAIDQGTTSCRALIFNENCEVIEMAQKEFTQYFPSEGWVEHDANEIWDTQIEVIKTVLDKADLNPNDITTIGITNQRETTLVWNKDTGEPIGKAIVWQDRRTSDYCDSIRDEWKDTIKKKTGLIIDAYFSGSKIKWLLDNTPGAKEAASNGKLLFGTMETWLIWKLTGGESHVTDMSNASRTMIFNIVTQTWDEELMNLMKVPANMLPDVKENMDDFGITQSSVFGASIPINGAAGDQQSALFGQMCLEPGSAKNTYGTGCFLVTNTGSEIIESKNQMLSTIGWKIKGEITYALEGSVFVAGAIVQWLRDSLGLLDDAAESEAMATSVENNGGVYLVPALTGLGAPHWDQDARGTILGLTRGSTKNHIVRAALEGIAYQVADVIKAMEADLGFEMKELKVDGGATNNEFLMKFQAAISDTPVIVAANQESTALGAAMLAGLYAGVWSGFDDLKSKMAAGKVYAEDALKIDREKLLKGWNAAIKRSLSK